MSNAKNNTSKSIQASLGARLVAFLVVLALGFVMGWTNSNESQQGPSPDIVATQQTAAKDATNQKDDEFETGTSTETSATTQTDGTDSMSDSGSNTVAPTRGPTVEEDGQYTSKDEVALYIHTYGHLPSNFISKTKARKQGWIATEGNLDMVCPGKSIGGSQFYNDEGRLPDAPHRRWTECDINYQGGDRGAERMIFSNDGLVFYTPDHYQTFEQLY